MNITSKRIKVGCGPWAVTVIVTNCTDWDYITVTSEDATCIYKSEEDFLNEGTALASAVIKS
jgi:hypothetical protein